MHDCATISVNTAPLPPNKRVNYAFGMVMGGDEFFQTDTHFEWKHALSNRLLHGYGTVCGLKVTAAPVAGDVEIRIAPGFGIVPTGKWVWVEREQCANLGQWLTRHGAELGAPPSAGQHELYVKLCYVECLTDEEPIAALPCATEDETRAPSRILESFRAELTWARPSQHFDDAVRRMGRLLDRIELVADPPSPDDAARLLELVRALATVVSPPAVESPPDTEPFRLWEATACDTIRQALLIWATEVCPQLGPQGEECILLACVRFDVAVGGALIPDSVVVDDCERPVLVPDRLKQELFCVGGGRGTPAAIGAQGPAGPPGPPGATGIGLPGPAGPGGVVRVNRDSVVIVGLPIGGTKFTEPITHKFSTLVPITMAVDETTEPSSATIFATLNPGREMNVALTAYYVGTTSFRIGATNLSGRDFEQLVIRWWAFEV